MVFNALRALALTVLSGSAALAQVHVPQSAVIESTTPDFGAKFGNTIALEGDLAAIGSYAFDPDVQLFRRRAGQWVFEASLRSLSNDPYEGFGSALAIADGRVFVGARFADGGVPDAGAVYVFEKSGGQWGQVQKVVQPGSAGETSFGIALDASHTSLVVGAPFADGVFKDQGAVYSYRRIAGTWTFEAQVDSPLLTQEGEFGIDLALAPTSSIIGEEMIAVGARGEGEFFQGRVHTFRRIGGLWVLDGTLEAPGGAPSDAFGSRVVAEADVIVASSLVHATPFVGCGAAYVFRRGMRGWSFEQKLQLTDPHAGDTFGRALALAGDDLVVGAPNAPDPAGPGQVAHYHFDGATWVEAHRWIADPVLGSSSVLDSPWLGYSVAMDAGVVLAGAARAYTTLAGQGLVFGFDVTPFALEATPSTASTGEGVLFRWAGGSPGGLAALVLRSANGIPVNALLHAGTLDAEGTAAFAGVVPPGLVGLQLAFEAGGHHDLAQTIQGSNVVTVDIH